ncbi:MAG: SGNH/GDSL hydrolase family protein [Carbonactinosporaceae bacterium]
MPLRPAHRVHHIHYVHRVIGTAFRAVLTAAPPVTALVKALVTAVAAALVATLATGAAATPLNAPPRATAGTPPPPDSMAALGDSITRAFDACGWYVDCPRQSWAAGDRPDVNSHYLRIRAKNPAIAGDVHNAAESGATMADLPGQARLAVSQHVGYVTTLMGANDACAPSEAAMTPVDAFERRFRNAMGILREGLPGTPVFVASIPDIKRLWRVGKDNRNARWVWDVADICQSMLADPRSTDPADVARRDRVRQRVVDYNAALAQTCREYANCRYDRGAVFSYPLTLAHVSRWDYFHPNTAGQAALAEATYRAGYNW